MKIDPIAEILARHKLQEQDTRELMQSIIDMTNNLCCRFHDEAPEANREIWELISEGDGLIRQAMKKFVDADDPNLLKAEDIADAPLGTIPQ